MCIVVAYGDRLDEDLRDVAVARGRSARVPDLAAHAVTAGTSTRVKARTWALIKFAADLRALDQPGDAVRVLEAASEMDLDDHTELALFTCAIAAHRDLGDLVTAQKLIDEQRARGVDERFERTAAAVEYDVATRKTQTAA